MSSTGRVLHSAGNRQIILNNLCKNIIIINIFITILIIALHGAGNWQIILNDLCKNIIIINIFITIIIIATYLLKTVLQGTRNLQIMISIIYIFNSQPLEWVWELIGYRIYYNCLLQTGPCKVLGMYNHIFKRGYTNLHTAILAVILKHTRACNMLGIYI